MLRARLIVAILLVPVAVAAIAIGGWAYTAGVLLILAGAGNEYVLMMRAGGRAPARLLVLAGIWLLALIPLVESRYLDRLGLAAFLAVTTGWHLVQFERGRAEAGWDWAATIAGVVYIGGLGSIFLLVRQLPQGQWWTLTIYPAIWLSDTGAYVIGAFVAGRVAGIGRHAMVPRLSPNKTWEGFTAGLIWGTLGGGIFGALWSLAAGPGSSVGFWSGALIGLVVSLIGPVGDLCISMLKRQVGVKDTGAALAGHGGMLDRIDSWLVAGAAGLVCVLSITGKW
jgi:phosphatidate cytidylyltransferase